MGQDTQRIVVVGSSAGGMDALTRLAAQLPSDFPAPVFIVNHMSPDTTGEALVQALDASGGLACQHARDGQAFTAGTMYLAPSDRHLLITEGRTLVTRGARENRSRPGIDPLFRSAAVAYGNRVVGIVLTGYLDDGTVGMQAIKRCGGVCIVQDPLDAAYPDMPQSVITHVDVDHCVPLAEMGAVLAEVLRAEPGENPGIPEDLVIEARIAQRVLSDLPSVEASGTQVPFTCPGCGGGLWQMAEGARLRYRCHTGHAFSLPELHAQQTAKIEETLWVALRLFEERRNLLLTMGRNQGSRAPASITQRIEESRLHIDRIRSMLQATDQESLAKLAG